MYLNTWHLAGGAFLEVYGILRNLRLDRRICPWGLPLRFYSLAPFSVCSLLSDCHYNMMEWLYSPINVFLAIMDYMSSETICQKWRLSTLIWFCHNIYNSKRSSTDRDRALNLGFFFTLLLLPFVVTYQIKSKNILFIGRSWTILGNSSSSDSFLQHSVFDFYYFYNISCAFSYVWFNSTFTQW